MKNNQYLKTRITSKFTTKLTHIKNKTNIHMALTKYR